MQLQTMPLKFRVWDKEDDTLIYCDTIAQLQFILAGVGNRAIISQDTGFIDKNCKSIYTGDILSYEYPDEEPIIGVVEYSAGGILEFKHRDLIDGKDFSVMELREVSIYSRYIGNIWQTPELLEEN